MGTGVVDPGGITVARTLPGVDVKIVPSLVLRLNGEPPSVVNLSSQVSITPLPLMIADSEIGVLRGTATVEEGR